jgi:hypothetical protein
VAKKVRAFENMGLVSIKKEGRCQIVRLLSLQGWEKQLESKRELLKSNGRESSNAKLDNNHAGSDLSPRMEGEPRRGAGALHPTGYVREERAST